jgi:iron complex outermembrane receptor protein
MKVSHLMSGVAFAALSLGLTTQAFAQSTGTQSVEKVVVTGERAGKGGTIIKEKRPKTRSTITEKYLGTQAAGQTVFQSLNLLPGLNFTNSDPYGSSGGNVRLRGFDGARVSLTQDGIPLNDTGNYAIFTNQIIDPEFISRATVNTGTTDVDSPTASATGGTINTITRKPYKDLTVSMNGAAGSWGYNRFAAVVDTGEYKGVSAFGGVSFTEYDKFKGPGAIKKTQGNARIYQEIGEKSFISVIGHYNENRNNFYRNLTLAQMTSLGDTYDNFSTCTRDTANGVAGVDGLVDNDQKDGLTTLAGGAENILNPGSCTNYYNLRINPSNTGNIRMQMGLQLTDTVRLTIDPSWQYVKANGGGTTVVNEYEGRLGGTGVLGSATGTDLNGDGDLRDQIRLYTPNNTNTSRFGVNASLIWEPSETDTFRVAYTGDHGRHRQTGRFAKLGAAGDPLDIFGALDSGALAILSTPDANVLRGRDRLSHAILNQVSASYTGRFLDETLVLDVGIRAPFFSRDLNQYCYSQVGSSNVICSRETFTDPDGDGVGQLLAQSSSNFYIAPRTATFEYNALLPNVGVSYEFEPRNIVFASYAEGLSAPRTDNLYTFAANETIANNVVGNNGAGAATVTKNPVEPETTQAFDLGYRYQGEDVTLSTSLWYNQFKNRVVSSFDENLGIFVDRNIGAAVLRGIDAEMGWQARSNLVLYGSVSYVQSEIQSNIPSSLSGGLQTFVPTDGKQVVETPTWTLSGRALYNINQNIALGLQGKYVDDRFSTDMNDEKVKGYMVFDADATLDLGALGWDNTILQFNAINLLNESYQGNINSTVNAQTVTKKFADGSNDGTQSGSAPSYSTGAPQTFQIQIKTKF